jgi:hypothetical protein
MENLIPEDKRYGSKNPNVTWSGIIGTVASKHADLRLNMLEYSTEPMDVIDFLTPSSHLGKHIVCMFQTSCNHSLQTLFFRTQQHFLRTTENAGLQPIANFISSAKEIRG